MLHFLGRLLRGFLAALLIVILLVGVAVAYLGYTSSGNQFLANRIAEQVSTPDMQISLEGASGLLEGRLHLDHVTLADTKGTFAEVQGLDIFWTPSELARMRFHADRIAAAKVVFDRPPVKTIESQPSNSTFSLPVEIKVDSFDLPLIALGKAIAKQDTVLGINGSAQAVSDHIALELNAAEKDRLNATAKAKVTYAVNTETLTLDGAVSEPQGGLLARLLALPGQPPVEVAVKGDGPLGDWKGSISGRVSGKDVLLLTGSHKLAEAGIREVTLNGGGRISEFLPGQLRSLFAGETKVDVDARFAETGLVDIRAGTISNDSFTLAAKGELDPKGQAKLTGSLSPARDVIRLELPLASGPVKADISKGDIVLSGAFRSATVDVSAALARLETPDVKAGALTLTAHSGDANLADKTASLSYALAAQTLVFRNPQIAKVAEGPLSLRGNVNIGPTFIALAQSDLESGKLGGKISGRYDRSAQTAAANFNLFLLPQGLLPANIESKINGTLGLSGQVTATLPSQIAVQNLKLVSNVVTATGSLSLNGDTVKAELAGNVPNLADFADKAGGTAHFTLDASGPLSKPTVNARLTSPEIKFADKTVQAVDLTLESALDLKRPGGKLTAAAQYQGQTIAATADARFDNGLVSIPGLNATIGQNSISGALGLDAAFRQARFRSPRSGEPRETGRPNGGWRAQGHC